MKSFLPIHSIEQFQSADKESGIYISDLRRHLQQNEFVKLPHKHDFYFIFFCTKGTGKHEMDFKTYDVKRGSVFFMYPGQTHRLLCNMDGEGYVLFHNRDFYDLMYNARQIKDYPFFYCTYNVPELTLKKEEIRDVEILFTEMLSEYKGDKLGRHQKICSLMDLLYIDLTRKYLHGAKKPPAPVVSPSSIRQLEELIEKHFIEQKSPAAYAEMMHITPKQLNRICRNSLGKTTSELITNRVMLEAKRILIHDGHTIADVAGSIGYFDSAYFTRVFRKNTGMTPAAFIKKHRTELLVG